MHITKALKKPVFVMIMLIFSLSIMATAWAAQPNADDLQGHWAETRLRSWSDQGLLQGYNGKFNPDRPVTRAELVTLINRSFEVSEPSSISFKDLETSHWAYDQIARAVKAGYIDGYNDNTVRPDHTVTREEAAVMVAKLTELVSA
ncbi:S-layer homology domain-containing protein, partial [Bacillus thuringiensis]|uniref:S-layer homology domain-containing protein n=1 Tax=Bacillus thuringiensis TaxID=1428 RepID=UPI002DB7F587